MQTAVPLQVEGVNLDDEDTAKLIAEHFSDFLWTSVDGLVAVTVYIESDDVTSRVVETARTIEHQIEGAKVRRVQRDLVNQSDIAFRVGVSREAVRKWTKRSNGIPFPSALGTVGGGDARTSMVWLWSDVVPWLHTTYGIDMDEHLPDDETIAHIDACLAKVRGYLDREWHTVTTRSPVQLPTTPQRVAARSALEAALEKTVHRHLARQQVWSYLHAASFSEGMEPVSA